MAENNVSNDVPEPEVIEGQAEVVAEEVNPEKEKQRQARAPHRRNDDPLGSLAWAAILIWAGLVFLADNLGWLANIKIPQAVLPEGFEIIKLGTWTLIFLGAGLIGLLEGILRLAFPAWRSSAGSTFFIAVIFLGIGLGNIFGWSLVWPIVLIGLGLSAMAGALIRIRK